MMTESFGNPYDPPEAGLENSTPVIKTLENKALKYIAHGIYLQLFLGAGLLAMSSFDFNILERFSGTYACGAMLVGLGLNSLIYVHRYKKSIR